MSIWRAKQDTVWQDSTSPALITKFNQVQETTTLSAPNILFSYNITVDDPTGIVLPVDDVSGSYIIIFSVPTGRVYFGHVIGLVGNVVTLDTQLDSVFPNGAFVDITTTNMVVDGSVTPELFGIRGLGVIPGVVLEVDITRIIITCYTTTAVSLNKFGNLPKLLRGLALRERNGITSNIFNVKSNGELAGILLDFIPYDAQNTQQGQHGFNARLTFASPEKLGVAKRLSPGDDLEALIQDNLASGAPDITFLEIVAEGSHVV